MPRGRPKGSKNKLTKQKPIKLKAQFANTSMANQLHAEFRSNGGVYAYPALKAKYQQIYSDAFFCLAPFEVSWKRLLKKVQQVHGVDYEAKHHQFRANVTKPRNRTNEE